jgi:hypothetical protein
MSGSLSNGATGQFHVVNGSIVDPNGKPFFARGVNVPDSQMGSVDQILAHLPGINFVRLAVFSYQPPEVYSSFIKTMSDHGIVVELENHTNGTGDNRGGARGSAFTGSKLAAESDWYSSVAHAYAPNPYVWFGTNNEPPQDGLPAWQQATYNAIRDAGNNNPIMIEFPGGGVPGLESVGYGMDPSVYGRMSNIVADIHYYGWESKFSTDQQTVDFVLSRLIQDTQTVKSHDGTLPVILGEYGVSTDGTNRDANYSQVVQAVQQSTQIAGAVAWVWHSNPNNGTITIDGQGNLSWFGQRVAQWIASSNTPAGASTPSEVTPDKLSIVPSGDAYQGSPQNRPAADFASLAANPDVETVSDDFNGDSNTDLALVNHAAGWDTVPVALSNATGFTVENQPAADFASLAASPDVVVISGDFNGDGRDDLALVNTATGWNTIPVALSSAIGFTVENRPAADFASLAASPDIEPIAGDFNGDGTDDIALINHAAGWNTVPVALSFIATGFTVENRPAADFASLAASPDVEPLAEDFNGDGTIDLALINHAAGWNTIPWALSSATGFTTENQPAADFASFAASPDVAAFAGDFNGDARGDLALVNTAAGWNSVIVALNLP